MGQLQVLFDYENLHFLHMIELLLYASDGDRTASSADAQII